MSNLQRPSQSQEGHHKRMNRLKSLGRVWNRVELPPLTRLVAIYLAEHVNSNPFRIKLADISRWVNAFSVDVIGALWELESAGLVRIELEHPEESERSIHDWCGHAFAVGELFPVGGGNEAEGFKKHAIFLKTKKHCYYCGEYDEDGNHQIEHCVPKSRGGTNEFYNLVGSCQPCNLRKGTLTVEEYRKKCEHEEFGANKDPDEYYTFAGEHSL